MYVRPGWQSVTSWGLCSLPFKGLKSHNTNRSARKWLVKITSRDE